MNEPWDPVFGDIKIFGDSVVRAMERTLAHIATELGVDAGNVDALLARISQLKGAESKLEQTSLRADHEERLRKSAERDCHGLSKSLEDEIRKNADLALEADHQRKCAVEWHDKFLAAESALEEETKRANGRSRGYVELVERLNSAESRLDNAIKDLERTQGAYNAVSHENGELRDKLDAMQRRLVRRLDKVRNLVAGLPPTGEPVLVARWLVDELKEAAK